MKGHIKIGWFIIISTIIILFIFQLFTLKEVYEHEKSLLSHTIEDVLKADISHLNVLCIKKGWSASYALSQNKIHYNIRNTDTVIPVNAHVNLDSLNRIIGYDIRNPRKWQPDTLARLLDTHLASENLHALPYRLTLTDSLGTLLSQYSNTKQQITSPEISLVFPLGYLEKHLLKAEFNFPLILFFKLALERILTSILLFILIICLTYLLYRLLKNEKKLRDNQKAFTHTLVHNLRRPILNIKCQLENLLSDQQDKTAISLNETYKRCKQWTDKTLEDIENLLTFSVDAYGLKACIQPTDIRELLTQITTEYRQNNSIGKQIDIQTEIYPTVPLAQVDPLLLYSALGNLLGNAIKYSGTIVRIRIGCRREAKKWILTVQDDGYGIPPEEQKFIFQEYKRGQRYKGDKQRKGFGLGLCYVAAVVKAHHGHIQVNSDGKQGTEFIIEIPQRKAKD